MGSGNPGKNGIGIPLPVPCPLDAWKVSFSALPCDPLLPVFTPSWIKACHRIQSDLSNQ